MLLAVPCSGANTVALLDAVDGSDVGRISVGAHPVHLAAADGHVLVATMDERSIDVVTDSGVERVQTGVLGPSHFAVRDNLVFVPCTGGDAVAVIDLDALELRDRIVVGAEPHDAESVGDSVYVGSRADGTVTVLNAETAAVRSTVDVAGTTGTGTRPRVQGLGAADGDVYAVDQTNARVVLLDEAGVHASAPVGANPYEPVIGSKRVFVAGRDDGTITVLSTDLSSATTHDVGGQPVDTLVVAGKAWVFDRDNPAVQSLSGDAVDLPYPGFAAICDPQRPQRAYVAHYDDDAVSAVDLDVGNVAWTVSTPAKPFEPLVV